MSFAQALDWIERIQRERYPAFNGAFRALSEYLRFWELAELDRLLYPHTTTGMTTATRFLNRSPAALARSGFEELSPELEAHFVDPFTGLFPLTEDWSERFLEGNDPLLEPYPIGPNFTTEDLDLEYVDLSYLDPGFAFFWLLNADWAIEPEERPVCWKHLTTAFGFPDVPPPVKTLGLAAGEYTFDAEAFRAALESAGLADFYTLLLVALGETDSPFVDYRPFEDGILPWELDFTPGNIQLLRKLYREGQEIMAVYEQALARLQAEPQIFQQLIDQIENKHTKRRRR
ncbi:MAG TPA: hypothetical protein VMN57_05085 [Anaerolineales bacterium]|nr:hypothetical protein [Anaerolineales bacterium]